MNYIIFNHQFNLLTCAYCAVTRISQMFNTHEHTHALSSHFSLGQLGLGFAQYLPLYTCIITHQIVCNGVKTTLLVCVLDILHNH